MHAHELERSIARASYHEFHSGAPKNPNLILPPLYHFLLIFIAHLIALDQSIESSSTVDSGSSTNEERNRV